ncbi:putative exported protein [Halobacteriovorax marinus SJ]|uniref:Exported protein n=1 Tax=Halobacteriovorax marinus (strain ATCC BAA-682 / DSM 15412 / SJ) TaxID=862908 RepID=E1X443_HALMS|nr:hypothetical protein [Halobacteriovorax marinus]CBW25383.1 putative exported protein [Halobacteriovorax marinus SJ]
MKNIIFGITLLLSLSGNAQELGLGAQERWLSQHGGFTCGQDRTPTQTPTEFKNQAIMFSYMTTDYTLDHGKLVASFHNKGTECRYNLVGLADNANWIFTKTDSSAYSVNGGNEVNCEAGKAYLDSLFAQPNTYIYGRGAISLQVKVEDAATLCGEGATHVGIYFKKSARTKI